MDYILQISEIIILCWVRSGYNATTAKEMMSEIYIMALRVGPKPQICKVGNHGIAHIDKCLQLSVNWFEMISAKWP